MQNLFCKKVDHIARTTCAFLLGSSLSVMPKIRANKITVYFGVLDIGLQIDGL